MPKPKVPDGYSDGYLHCRTFGHNWAVGRAESQNAAFIRLVLSCRVCGTERHDTLNRRTGSLAHRHYAYVNGYQAEAHEGLGRITYRVEFIRRIEHD